MIRGIHHAAISTGDAERLLHFYRDLLGFEVVSDHSWQSGADMLDAILGLHGSAARSLLLRKGDGHLEIFQFQSPRPKPGDSRRPVCDHGLTHICLDVIDIQAEYERLRSAGMAFHCPPQDFGAVRNTYGRDPDGNVIELQEIVAAATSAANG